MEYTSTKDKFHVLIFDISGDNKTRFILAPAAEIRRNLKPLVYKWHFWKLRMNQGHRIKFFTFHTTRPHFAGEESRVLGCYLNIDRYICVWLILFDIYQSLLKIFVLFWDFNFAIVWYVCFKLIKSLPLGTSVLFWKYANLERTL